MSSSQGFFQKVSAQVQSYLPELNQEHHRQVAAQIGPQLSAEEVLKHPEFPHTNWDLKPDVKGSIDVAAGRGGPLKLAYEIHGRGSKKIVVSMILFHFQFGGRSWR